MTHLNVSALRQILDEPEAFSEDERRHAAECAECRAQSASLRESAAVAAMALRGKAESSFERALARVERDLGRPQPGFGWYTPAAVLAAAIILALIFTPLGGYASALLTIFQPKAFVPIDFTQAELRNFRIAPQAKELGTLRVVTKAKQSPYESLSQAKAHLAFTPLTPALLPSQYAGARHYAVSTPSEYVYTFSASKARTMAAKLHQHIAPMPAALDGTTVRVRLGEVFQATYGIQRMRHNETQPSVELVEMQIPTVTSRGASFQQLERYMLRLPGITPALAAQLRELRDLQGRMPVPINIDKQISKTVTIDGVTGLAVGDNTGLGAGIIWQKNGIVYGIAGNAMTMKSVLALANGLQ